MEIEEYSVCHGDGVLALSRAVNQAIREGWQPFGSMVSHGTALYQPIVRYRDPEA